MTTLIDTTIEDGKRRAWAERAGIDRRRTPRETPDRRAYDVPANDLAEQLERERLAIEQEAGR